MIERAVILATDRARHHSMLTYNRAHPMLPAVGKPMVARVMDRLHRAGIRKFTVIVGIDEGAVAAYLDTHWQPDAEVDFVVQGAGIDLTQVLVTVAGEYGQPFMVCGYNSFTHTQFPESLLKHNSDNPKALVLGGATASLSKSQQHYYAIVDGQRVTEITASTPSDLNHFALSSLMVCGQSFVDYLGSLKDASLTTYDMGLLDIARLYIRSGGEARLNETAWILQIEADRDLLVLNKHLLDDGQDAHILSELPYTVQIIPPVRIDPQVNVGQGAKIGPHVYLERGSSIGHEVIIRNAIILGRAKVPARKSVFDTIISTRGPIP